LPLTGSIALYGMNLTGSSTAYSMQMWS